MNTLRRFALCLCWAAGCTTIELPPEHKHGHPDAAVEASAEAGDAACDAGPVTQLVAEWVYCADSGKCDNP